MARNKGSSGERELLKLLSEELGLESGLNRNLSQTRGGGSDCIELKGWAIEVKRQEKLNIVAWWKQTVEQATNGDKPILFYRANRMPWKAVLFLEDAVNVMENDNLAQRNTMIVDFDCACMVIRESL